MVEPMLCYEVEVNGFVRETIREYGMDGAKVTAAYRKAIVEELKEYVLKGFVAERKATQVEQLIPFFPSKPRSCSS